MLRTPSASSQRRTNQSGNAATVPWPPDHGNVKADMGLCRDQHAIAGVGTLKSAKSSLIAVVEVCHCKCFTCSTEFASMRYAGVHLLVSLW